MNPSCDCHDEPMYWNKKSDCRGGGYWECAVRRRRLSAESHARHRDKRLAQRRARYDADAVYRIGKCVDSSIRRRAAAIAKLEEGLHGSVSQEG